MFSSLPASVRKNTRFGSPVTAISRGYRIILNNTPDDDPHILGHGKKVKIVQVMRVSINGSSHPQDYSAVISTVPLPCLGLMDLSNSGLHEKYAQWNAIRALSYGPALRVGMRFTTAWWRELPQPITGGQSFTDLTIRNMWVARNSSIIDGFSTTHAL